MLATNIILRSPRPHHLQPIIRRFFHVPRNVLQLRERGLIQEVFPKESSQALATHLEDKPRVVYAGFDPTADSLHIGNLLVLSCLLHCQRAGHDVIALIGGGTARIGDPSGKSEERPMLDSKALERNVSGIRANLESVAKHHAELFASNSSKLGSFKIVNNADWYREKNLIDFVSTQGRHFRMGTMLGRKSVRTRLQSEEGLSFTEFTYQIFQAYDWLHLRKQYNCTVQLGGSDQMGNFHAGHELFKRAIGEQAFGITLPLVTSEKGDKLGKTAGTPVWLSPDKTTPFDLYQYLLRTQDADCEKMLRFFSFLPMCEIDDIMHKMRKSPERRHAQRALAEHVTSLVHGQQGLDSATTTTAVLFDGDVSVLEDMEPHEAAVLFSQADYVRLLLTPGMTVLDLGMKIGCFHSEKDAVRIISSGGFYVNQVRRANTEEVLVHGDHMLKNDMTLVRVGKKNFYIVDWSL